MTDTVKNKTGIFREEGMVLKVEILKVTNKNEWEETTLKAIEMVHFSTIIKKSAHPKIGSTFTVGCNPKYRAYAGWYLQKEQ